MNKLEELSETLLMGHTARPENVSRLLEALSNVI